MKNFNLPQIYTEDPTIIGTSSVADLNVKDIMIKSAVSAEEDIPLIQAIELLYEKHVGSIIVLDKKRGCKGIFTTRDPIRAIAQKTDLETPLRDVMTKSVVTIPEDASFSHAKDLMIKNRIRHIPVENEEGEIIGIVTIRSVLDKLIGYPTVKN